MQDENKKRRVVHIKEGLNQDYILKNLKFERLSDVRNERETLVRLQKTPRPRTKEESEAEDEEMALRFFEGNIEIRKKET